MKTVETFLAEVAALRLNIQIEERKAFRAPPIFEFPPALEVALRHRWQIAPVLARSPLALNSASVGVPSSDSQQIAYWLARYPEANWSPVTGPQSRVMGLEIEMTLAGSWLAELLEDDWPRTLRFMSGSRCFMLFASSAGLHLSPGTPACDYTPAPGS